MEWLRFSPIILWISTALPSLFAVGDASADSWGVKGFLEMTALSALVAVLLFLVRKHLPQVMRDHKEERKEWAAERQARDTQFLEALNECRSGFACRGNFYPSSSPTVSTEQAEED